MEYLYHVHKVGLPKEYPAKIGNIWFGIGATANISNDTISDLRYQINVDHDSKLNQQFHNYQIALDYYNSLVRQPVVVNEALEDEQAFDEEVSKAHEHGLSTEDYFNAYEFDDACGDR